MPGFNAILEASGISDWPSRVPARVMFQIPRYAPGRRAKDIRTPILFCICDRDSVTPARKTDKYAAQAVRSETLHYDAGHFEIYVGDLFETVVCDQISFLAEHVPTRPLMDMLESHPKVTPGAGIAQSSAASVVSTRRGWPNRSVERDHGDRTDQACAGRCGILNPGVILEAGGPCAGGQLLSGA